MKTRDPIPEALPGRSLEFRHSLEIPGIENDLRGISLGFIFILQNDCVCMLCRYSRDHFKKNRTSFLETIRFYSEAMVELTIRDERVHTRVHSEQLMSRN